jgi:diguanylate cyclase (GGDEF)-like protein
MPLPGRCVAPGLTALLVCVGLISPAGAQQYSFRFFGTQEGLSNLAVKVLFQDRIGFLWAATENGLFRYDGTRFQNFGPEEGLPRAVLLSLGEAPDGSLLAGGAAGLYRLLGKRFERLALPRNGVVDAYNGIRYNGSDRTFVATNHGLVVARAGRHSPLSLQLLTGDEAHGLFLEKDWVWYGCGTGLCRAGPAGRATFGPAEGLPAGRWICIRRDGAGNLWASDKHRFAMLRRGETRLEIKTLGMPPPAGSGQFEMDGAGRLLVPTTAGLAIQQGGGWRLISKRESLRAPVYAVLQDREGSMWLGLAGRGLARWQGYGQWEAFAPESGLDSELMYEVLPLGGDSVWLGTETGLFHGRRHGAQWTWQRDARIGKLPVHAVRMSLDGHLWLGTEGYGAVRLRPGGGAAEWVGKQQGLLGESPYALATDRQGRVWAGTERGLFVTQRGGKRFHQVAEVPAIRCWTVAASDEGDILAGTVEGLYWQDGGGWRHVSMANGLLHNTVLAVAARSREIWVGYWFTGRVTRITRAGGRLAFTHYGQQSGVRGEMTYFLGFDARGRVWSGSDQGVRVWDGVRWRHYDQSDGLIWNDCDLGAFAPQADGSVWIGTSNGLAHFTPHQDANPPPASAILTELRLGNRDVADQPGFQASFRENSLVVRYSALAFAREASLMFRYRLLPIGREWVETKMRELTFPDLPPNEYRLEVQARAGVDGWGQKTAAFTFTIQPPWWDTWWCRSLTGLAALGGLVALWRWRVYVLMARQKELEAAVVDRTRQLREQAIRDGLTGLLNRNAFFEVLECEIARTVREGGSLAFALVDLDHFKSVNDTYGHQAGDAVLKESACRMVQSLRSYDTVGRYGGEELAILMPGCGPEHAAKRAEQMRRSIAEAPFVTPAGPVTTTASFGVTVMGSGCGSVAQLLQAADRALYAAKARGRNCVVAWTAGITEPCEASELFGVELPR